MYILYILSFSTMMYFLHTNIYITILYIKFHQVALMLTTLIVMLIFVNLLHDLVSKTLHFSRIIILESSKSSKIQVG